ncbi:sulfate reduction electron transfer complex DsrMKJOP subunit DsrJ [Geomobilimonas luticola]|uniref:Sulfate reduction electron transfer complex DsrMKJOP subunit DsrJ n=1 Tax=Geomobilimonas luticola TaxID=1114878 RepID=A0ABS5S7V0_9BACT|nr:sulfate reduction electron transfer complex DsrMKJOP subunit DsrJ [Geomobilimonas luticola]MBT0651438.1 sulfate reduction electron transfer complex DsrMKJOP subunit DsrJ [Geomobilimonas luticola]
MGDRPLIYGGLCLFVALVTFPVWKGVAAQSSTKGPEVKAVVDKKQCVAPRAYMREAHMELLVAWRDGKVRRQERHYTARDGTVYNVSLTGTCLTQCHGSKEKFCDSCHEYAGVSAPNCWGCHTSPPAEPAKMAAAAAGEMR